MRRNLVFRAVCLSWCVVATAPALLGQQPQTVAHVLDIKGDWRVQGTTTLAVAGAGIAAGGKIAAMSNRQGDAITIVRDADMSRLRIACDSSPANPCRNPIAVEGGTNGTPTQTSQLKGLVQAAIALLLDQPPAVESHYALTLTRGKETVRESEAVVALDASQGIVLPPPPPDMQAGRYTISIAHPGDASSATEQPATLTSEGVWRPLHLEAAGLYEVSIRNEDQEQVADVMLLVTPAMQYQAKQDAFEAMKAHTATWTGPDARADEHLFLRAFLLSQSHT